MRTDGQTNMPKLKVAFRNFANASNEEVQRFVRTVCLLPSYVSQNKQETIVPTAAKCDPFGRPFSRKCSNKFPFYCCSSQLYESVQCYGNATMCSLCTVGELQNISYSC